MALRDNYCTECPVYSAYLRPLYRMRILKVNLGKGGGKGSVVCLEAV